jgi:hypothetical protein
MKAFYARIAAREQRFQFYRFLVAFDVPPGPIPLFGPESTPFAPRQRPKKVPAIAHLWPSRAPAGYNGVLRCGNRAVYNFFLRFGAGARERHCLPRSAA